MKKFFVFIFVLLNFCAITVAQNVTTLRFTGQGQNGSYVQLSSVEVTNLTRGWDETLVYPDTILMLGAVGIDDYSAITQFALSQNTPNPFKGSTDFTLQLPEHAKVVITVFDISGKKVTDITKELPAGIHIFRVILNTPQAYLVTARTDLHSASIKIVNQGKASHNRIEYRGMGSGHIRYEIGGPKSVATGHDFHQGDLMCYVGKYLFNDVEYVSDTILQPQYGSEDFTLVFPCVPVSSYTFSATTCDTFFLNGITYTESGTYTQTFPMDNGCDSIVTLNLLVNQPSAHTVDLTVCGEYVWNGEPYSQSGTYTQTFPTENECDSIVTLNLTVNQPVQHSFAATTCDTYVWNGEPYSQSGSYTQTFTAANECDSIVTLNLTVNPPVTHSFSDASCLYYVWNGQTYTQSGSYTQIFQAANGCDSVVTLNLTVNQPVTHSFSDASCLFYIWNGLTYTQSGTFTQILQAANGCDSIVTLDLTITQPVTHSFSATACGSYTWNGVTYTQSGSYTQTFTAANGCDSTVTLNLTVNALTVPTVSEVQVYEVGMHSAYLVSSVQSDDCTTIQAQGFCWDTLPNPDMTGNHIEVAVVTTSLYSLLRSLEANRTYYVRAYATNAMGTGYSEQAVFTTEEELGTSFDSVTIAPPCSVDTAIAIQADMGTITTLCVDTDGVQLLLNNYQYGDIQWQFSLDTLSWFDIDDEKDIVLTYFPDQTQYVRAAVSYNNCPTEYSEVKLLMKKPTAYAGFSRTVSVGDTINLNANREEAAVGMWQILQGSNGFFSQENSFNSKFFGSDSLYWMRWTLTNACGSSSDEISVRYVQTVTTDRIVMVDTTDIIFSDSAQIEQGIYIISFSDPNIVIGDSTIIVSLINGGFLRMVYAWMMRDDSTYVMYTSQATIYDILQSGVFQFDAISGMIEEDTAMSHQERLIPVLDHIPTRNELRSNPLQKMYIMSHELIQGDGTRVSLLPTNRGLYTDSATNKVEFNKIQWGKTEFIIDTKCRLKNINFTLEAKPTLEYIRDNRCVRFGIYNGVFTLTGDLECSIMANGTINIVDWDILKGEVDFAVPIGPIAIPMSLIYGINFELSGTLDVTETVQHTITATANITKGIRYYLRDERLVVDDNCSGSTDISVSSNAVGSVDLTASLSAMLNLRLALLAGPRIKFGYKAKIQYCHNLYGNLGWRGNISSELFLKLDLKGAKIIDPILPDWLSKEWTFMHRERVYPYTIQRYSGNSQIFSNGQPLALPIKVIVKGSGEHTIRNARVYFRPKDGGTVSDSIAFTDRHGIAQTIWTPNVSTESHQLKAYVYDCEQNLIGGAPVEFNAYNTIDCSSSTLNLRYKVTGNTLTVIATGGVPPYKYSVNDATFVRIVPVLNASENYTLTVKDAYGCSCSITYGNTSLSPCERSNLNVSVTVIDNNLTLMGVGGTPPYRYSIDGQAYSSSNVFNSLTAGNHSVKVIDAGNCEYNKMVTIEEATVPSLPILSPPVVHSSSINNISSANHTASCGGNVISDGGATVTARGVCWSTSSNPTVQDNHTIDGSGTGAFTSTLTNLAPLTTYYVRAYATNSVGTAYGEEVTYTTFIDGQPCPGLPTFTDIDGNNYNTVQIGYQCWMKENLRTTRYANGSPITLEENMDMTSISTPYRYKPNNDINNVELYGYLYNWRAVMLGAASSDANPSGVQGICPAGWHVPSNNEWIQLKEYIKGQNQYRCNSYSYMYAKALAATSGWESSSLSCTIGNDPSTNNSTGFSAFPAGDQIQHGITSFGREAFFSSSTEATFQENLKGQLLSYQVSYMDNYEERKYCGLSVRCVLGEGVLTASLPSVITNYVENMDVTNNTAICEGNVSSDGGATVTARGICWSTSPNPTVEDYYTIDGSGTGAFTSTLTNLAPLTTYYVRAYATNSAGTAYGEEVTYTTFIDGQPCPGLPTFTDIDGNNYNTVQIGYQCWMKENLKTTRYANGSIIGLVSVDSANIINVPYRFSPGNDISNVDTYGYLYNWKAVMLGSESSDDNPSGVQGICPTGWHVPSSAEWTQLTDHVNTFHFPPQANALASQTGWNTGSLIDEDPDQNNATGFSALPAGGVSPRVFECNGWLYSEPIGSGTAFWTSTSSARCEKYAQYLGCNSNAISSRGLLKEVGLSVRCVRGEGELVCAVPVVNTGEVGSIDYHLNTSICEGSVAYDGGTGIITRGVCWSTSPNPTLEDNHTVDNGGIGAFTGTLTNLRFDTTYYVRAYATNAVGTAYGNEVVFIMSHQPPVVETTESSNITSNSAICGGNVTSDGGLEVTARGVCWSIYPNPTISDGHTTDGTGLGTFISNIADLTPNTLYHVRAYATNGVGTGYGNEVSFITPCDTFSVNIIGDLHPCYDESTTLTASGASRYWWSTGESIASITVNPTRTKSFLLQERFENDSLPGWITIDTDLDGLSWGYLHNLNWAPTHSGNGCIASWDTYGSMSLTPDDWLVTPAVTIPADVNEPTLSWWARNYYPYETTNYAVYIITTDTTIENPNSVPVHEGTPTGSYVKQTVDLSAYSGQTIKIVFRHYNVTTYVGMLFLDDIEVYYWVPSDMAEITVTGTNVFGCTATDSVIVSVNNTNLPVTETSPVSDITAYYATCGGEVISDAGADVIARGVCWSTSPHPTINDRYTIDGSGTGVFTSSITGLNANTTYYVRAYATNSCTSYGEEMSFTTLLPPPPIVDEKSCPGTPTVTDYDSNVYNTVKIGTQCWMRENLRTTNYSDGTAIPMGNSNYSYTDPYYYDYYNSGFPLNERGYLYNLSAVMKDTPSSNEIPSGVQGICPIGWHVPSAAEWTQMTTYMSSHPEYTYLGIAKALASTTGWETTDYGCAVGNDQSVNNASGFCAVPAGRYDYGSFFDAGQEAEFWLSSEEEDYSMQDIASVGCYMHIGMIYSCRGASVRCLRDSAYTAFAPTVTTSSVNEVTSSTAICGGNVINDGDAIILSCGICWSTSPSPTLSNNHTNDGSGLGEFNSTILGMTSGTTYYVRAYATNSAGTAYGEEVIFTTLASNSDTAFICGLSTVTDHEGNEYHTVSIGSQCWTKENLRTTTSPSTGTYLIPTNNSGLSFTGKQAFWYNNDSATYAPMNYGLLYNWNAAVDTFNTAYGETSVDTSSDHSFSVTCSSIRRGICPEGWHIPTDAEWTALNNYMSSQSQFTCGGDSNNIAKALASATGWETDWWNNGCSPMSSPSTNNASGFSALPAGVYLYDIVCESDDEFKMMYCDTILSNDGLGEFSLFWCASQNNGENAWCRFISVSDPYLEKEIMHKNTAGSVRCVYNADTYNSVTVPTVTTSAVTIISDNVAASGGEVLSDGGTPVIARGVCWNTTQNPTVSDNHTTDGDGTGNFTSSMTGLTGVSTFYMRAYATNCVGTAYGEEVRFTTVPYPAVQPCPESPTVTDYDGNVYNTLQIGNQCWMRENLRTTHFPEGTAITEGMLLPAPMGGWGIPGDGEPTIADPAYYRVNINGVYDTLYGLLYNWSAVMHGMTSPIEDSVAVQGICPDGWHVPSGAEWNMLMDYVSSQSIYWCGNDSLNVAKPLAATTGWFGSYSSCSIGNNQNANNAIGFSAFPAGCASKTASYPNSFHFGLGTDACFWSSSSSSAYNAVGYCLLNNAANISTRMWDKDGGFSVRCLRGEGQTYQEGGVGSGTGEGGADTGSGGGVRP